MHDTNVRTAITYIARDDLYQSEKAYDVQFPVNDIPGAKAHNHIFERKASMVYDIRGQPDCGINDAGFTFVKAATALQPADFETDETVKTQYFDEISQMIRREFPQYSKVLYLNHELRKRSPAFPEKEGEKTLYAQPLTLPHRDFTVHGACMRLEQTVGSIEFEALRDKPYDQLNIWRVLKGPNNDWPLAVCDCRTVNWSDDPLPNDVVYRDEVNESSLLHGSDSHKWYYMSDQEVDDVLVFRNTGSEGRDNKGVWHVAFENPGSSPHQYRESIEIRVFAFLKDSN